MALLTAPSAVVALAKVSIALLVAVAYAPPDFPISIPVRSNLLVLSSVVTLFLSLPVLKPSAALQTHAVEILRPDVGDV